MAVTIPRLNSQTRAGTTPAFKDTPNVNMAYRDAGIDDAALDAMKSLGGAAITAKENKANGMANATINEFHRRMDKWYNDAINSNSYLGYDAENLMGDMRKYAYSTIDDLKMNGFVKADGSKVPALEASVFEGKFLPSADTMLIGMDSNAVGHSAREIAIAEENDFNANVDRISLTVVNSDDPIMQADASNELNGLYKAYYGGRMRDEARLVSVNKTISAALGTRAKNLAATNPAKALHEFTANKNYSLYSVDLSEARKTAIENMATIAGTNDALVVSGLESAGQNWSDVPLNADADPVLKNRYPYSAKGSMTAMEYANYVAKKAEVYTTKKSTLHDDERRRRIDGETSLLSDLGGVETQKDYNELVENVVQRGDAHSMNVLNAVQSVKGKYLTLKQEEEEQARYSLPDGSFNEQYAIHEAYMIVGKHRPDLISENGVYSDELVNYLNAYVLERRKAFDERAEFIKKNSDFAITSSKNLDKVYSLIYGDSDGQRIETLQDVMPYIEGMTPSDAHAVYDALIVRAQNKKAAENLAKNEGGNFDVYNLASEQWKALGNKFKFEDGSVSEGDAEARQKFISRFVDLYIRKHSNEKPNSEELLQLSLEAYNTYKKTPRYEDVSRATLDIRKQAARMYEKADVQTFEVRDAVRDFLEYGGQSILTKENKAKVSEAISKGTLNSYYSDAMLSSFNNLSPENYVKDLPFSNEDHEDIWESLVEIYDDAEYTEKEQIVDFVVGGNNSALLRILKAKGKI